MPSSYETIIIGAGPAGCAAAHALATGGKQVLLLDKCEFPRLKPCAGALTIKTLKTLPFDPSPVTRRICSTMKLSFGEYGKTLTNHGPIAAMTVRQEFDKLFLDRCIQHGVEFKSSHRLIGLSRDKDGWIIATNHGSFHAKYLIGADGANSQLRKLLLTKGAIKTGLALETCIPYQASPDSPMEFDFAAVARGYGWIFPKNDHLNVGLYTLNPTIPSAQEKLAQFVTARTGRQITQPIHGHKITYNGGRLRQSWPDACLIGDAAGFMDPFLGEGIYNAVRSGQLAARAILNANKSRPPDFFTALREIQLDLSSYDSETRRFYSNVPRGYRRLTRTPLGNLLIKGFTLGWPVRRIKRRILVLPFVQSVRRKEKCNSA